MTELPQCVIVAGGRGSRLRPITDTVPKALVDVAGEPLAIHQLRWLAGQGVERVVFSIGYRGDQIRQALLGADRRFGLQLDFVDEGDRKLGTGGALRLAADEGALEDVFLLLYGDSYLDVDLASVVDRFHRSGAEALMTVCRRGASDLAGNVRLEGSHVGLYDKSPSPTDVQAMQHIDYGVSVLRRTTIEVCIPGGAPFDLGHVLGELSRAGRVAGYEVPHRFHEIGSHEGLAELRAAMGPAT